MIVTVDGINITTAYGVFVTNREAVVCPPEMKEVKSVSWAEENGIDVDLENPKFKSREFPISFGTYSGANVDGFLNLLKSPYYHVFVFADLGLTLSLRMTSCSDFNGSFSGVMIFTLTFSEDEPYKDYEYQTPIGGKYPAQGYAIDGKDLSEYGIAVLEGTDAEILKEPKVKKNYEFTNSKMNGILADPNLIKFEAKDVRLNLLMTATTGPFFTRNMMSFFYDLMRPKKRSFYFSKNGKTYDCYYVKSEVKEFVLSNGAWCQLIITLKFI